MGTQPGITSCWAPDPRGCCHLEAQRRDETWAGHFGNMRAKTKFLQAEAYRNWEKSSKNSMSLWH